MKNMPQNPPHPGYAITIKDVLKLASEYYLHNQEWDFTQEQKDKLRHESIEFAMEFSKAVADPRHFTMTEELEKLRNYMLTAFDMLQHVQANKGIVPQTDFLEALSSFLDGVAATLQIEKAPAPPATEKMAAPTMLPDGEVPADDPTVDNVIKFGQV